MPAWKRACGYTVLTVFLLVIVATWLSHYYPEYCPRFLEHWDATRNTQTIFEDYDGDKDREHWSFAHGENVWHLGLIYSMHICFLSGITTPQSHCKLTIMSTGGKHLLDAVTLLNFGAEEINPFLGHYLSIAQLHIYTHITLG